MDANKLSIKREMTSYSLYRDSSDSLRTMLSENQVLKPLNKPRILLVDDDPVFGKILQRVAGKFKIEITFCENISELILLDSLKFDVAVIDYDLGLINGCELTHFLQKSTSDEMPVILISHTFQKPSKAWPDTIKEFIHKDLGPYAIIDAVFEAHEITRINPPKQDKSLTH